MFNLKTLVIGILVFLTLGITILWISQRRTVVTINNLKTGNAQRIADSSEETITSLEASISGLLARIVKLEKAGKTSARKASTSVAFQPQTLYLGSASLSKHKWTNTGVEVTINSSDYPADVSAVFEAGLSIIGGEIWARLINKTTGAVINTTEVMHNKDSIVWKSSPAFELHSGNNTYLVQLRSSSGEIANLSGARVKISR